MGTNVNPADLMTKPFAETENGAIDKLMGHQFVENDQVKPKDETYLTLDENSTTLDKCFEPQARGATSKRRAGWCWDRQYRSMAVESFVEDFIAEIVQQSSDT